ncbi:MAG: hypothetical protein AAFX01_04170 [Cyanobacteria bacterium J06638_28]
METRSRAANLVRRPRYGPWVHGLLIAEAVLLILVAGSVVLVVAWEMFNNAQPLPTSPATLSLPPERSLATATGTTPCIVRSVETMPVQGRICISES